jgi:hypothetical protein
VTDLWLPAKHDVSVSTNDEGKVVVSEHVAMVKKPVSANVGFASDDEQHEDES